MQRRYNLTHFLLASVVVLGLTPLMAVVDAQAQIAFTSRRDGNSEIYVMDADGGNQQNLSNNRQNDANPSWSPDGKRIAFMSNRDDAPKIHVHMVCVDAQAQRRIAFMSDRDWNWDYVMDADGGNQRNLTNS